MPATGYINGQSGDEGSLLASENLADLDDAATARANLGVGAGGGDLLASENLNDLDNAVTARTNLGLGTAAVAATGDFATAAQGTLADSALQSADIDTIAEINANLISETLIDTADSRLSDARTPTAHNHDASDIDSGTLADARVAESNVTQHKAALDINESQINDIPADVSGVEITAGTETLIRRYSPADIKSFVDTHAPAGGGDLSVVDIDEIAELNAILTDATLIDTGDSRLSDSRPCDNTFDDAATSRTALGLGDSATKDVGTGAGDVAAGDGTGQKEAYGIAASDEETDLTASTSVPLATIHAQYAQTLSEILIGVTTAPTGSTLTADVHLNGTTVFSTKPTIDAGEKTSVTAATAAVLSTTAVAKGDLIEFFADSVGATVAGAGLKFYINSIR